MADQAAQWTVTLTVTDRPHYLRQTLEHLRQVRGIEQWHLFIGLEPGCPECAQLCEAIDFMPRTILSNPQQLGIRGNPFYTMQYAFDLGSQVNIYLEDDIVLSPDVAELALWYQQTIETDQLFDVRIMLLNLFVTSIRTEPVADLGISQFFSPWGMVINAFQWKNFIEPAWWNDEHRYPHQYDWTLSLSEVMNLQDKLFVLAPLVSRSTNIGREGGLHSHPERFDLLMNGLQHHKGEQKIDYKINNKAQIHWRRLDYAQMTAYDE